MKYKKALVYVSKSKIEFDQEKLEDMVGKASNANGIHGISGYLYYDGNKFLQYIEGENEKIDQLFENIEKDGRHEVLNKIVDEKLKEYRYTDWGMRNITAEELKLISMETLIINLLKEYHNFSHSNDIMNAQVWRIMDMMSQNQWRLVQ